MTLQEILTGDTPVYQRFERLQDLLRAIEYNEVTLNPKADRIVANAAAWSDGTYKMRFGGDFILARDFRSGQIALLHRVPIYCTMDFRSDMANHIRYGFHLYRSAIPNTIWGRIKKMILGER